MMTAMQSKFEKILNQLKNNDQNLTSLGLRNNKMGATGAQHHL